MKPSLRKPIWLLIGVCWIVSGCSNESMTTPTGGGIDVFRLADFQGDSETFTSDVPSLEAVTGPCGEVVLTGFTQRGSWRNCIASLRVSPGWQVTLYSDLEFLGGSASYTSNINNVRNVQGPCNGSWHECISSLRVSQR